MPPTQQRPLFFDHHLGRLLLGKFDAAHCAKRGRKRSGCGPWHREQLVTQRTAFKMPGMRTLSTYLGLGISTLLLAGCQALPSRSVMDPVAWQAHLQRSELPAIGLLGEQHNAPEHQQWQHDTVQALIDRQQLAALVLEMADHGHSTHGLPHSATAAAVKNALQWNEPAWPWHAYGPTVMTAVRAGVPVVGGNLPRAAMQTVMQQPVWDSHLPAAAWQRQREAIRTGHCNLLPEAQITPMARIQLAKDARMAQTLRSQLQPGKTVLLIAGRGHVLRSVGVPTWLPATLHTTVAIAHAGHTLQGDGPDSDHVVLTPALAQQDHCAALRAQWGAAAASAPSNK